MLPTAGLRPGGHAVLFCDILSQLPSAKYTSLATGVIAGDPRALARAITLVENDDVHGWRLVGDVYEHTGRARTIGVTGPPGAGKSTLIGALASVERAAGHTVAVLSVDPSSTFTRGALLGDRLRLAEHFADPGVFIRSMATRGALGGMAEAAFQAVLLMDAAGREVILLETVGVGQSEIDVATHADTIVLVLTPTSGDAVQALKAGVMEIPDVIAITHGADERATALRRDLRGVLDLDAHAAWRVPIALVDAPAGVGVTELHEQIGAHHAFLVDEGGFPDRRRASLLARATAIAMARLRAAVAAAVDAPGTARLVDEALARRLDPSAVARAILDGAIDGMPRG